MRRLPTIAFALAVIAVTVAVSGCSAPPPPPGPVLPANWPSIMLAEVNSYRTASGVAPLSESAALDRSAQGQSAGQAAMGKLSHTGANGSTMEQRANAAGYVGWNTLGENVGSGYGSVEAVVVAWMSDAPHRANLLGAQFTNVGFGIATGGNGIPYWTQDFGRAGAC